jgi:hypothetical protein
MMFKPFFKVPGHLLRRTQTQIFFFYNCYEERLNHFYQKQKLKHKMLYGRKLELFNI